MFLKAASPLLPAALMPALLVSCFPFENKSCTMELRYTPCVTINGSDAIDSKYSIFQVRDGLIVSPDTHSRRCFSETLGWVTLFVMAGDSLVAQTKVKLEAEPDGCHTKPMTVNFDIPE